MNRIGIHCQQREPRVVGRQDRSSERMVVDVTNFEILEGAATPSSFDDHLDHTLLFPPLNSRTVEPKLFEDRFAVLSQRWNRVHLWLDGVHPHRRNQGR